VGSARCISLTLARRRHGTGAVGHLLKKRIVCYSRAGSRAGGLLAKIVSGCSTAAIELERYTLLVRAVPGGDARPHYRPRNDAIMPENGPGVL
jgi:hypothetical protein